MTLFDDFLYEEDLIFLKSQFSEAHWVKLKSIFELAETLSLTLTKLDTELGLAQPQLVPQYFPIVRQSLVGKFLRFSLTHAL